MTMSFFPQFRRMKSYGADGVATGRQGGEAGAVGPEGASKLSPVGALPALGVLT